MLLSSYPERNVEILHLLGVVWAAPILDLTVTRLGIRQIMRRLMNSRAAGANEPTIFISFHEFRTSHQLLYTLFSWALPSGVTTSEPSISYTLGVPRYRAFSITMMPIASSSRLVARSVFAVSRRSYSTRLSRSYASEAAFDPSMVERATDEVDVCIVGGGPAGLAAAIRLKQLEQERGGDELRVVVLEKGSEVGMWSCPTQPIVGRKC